jgi:hypothetical protein
MSMYPPYEPPREEPEEEPVEFTQELRDYMVACIRAARPSNSRDAALRLLGEPPEELEDAWETAAAPVDWNELELDARLRGCTVADLIAERAARPFDDC